MFVCEFNNWTILNLRSANKALTKTYTIYKPHNFSSSAQVAETVLRSHQIHQLYSVVSDLYGFHSSTQSLLFTLLHSSLEFAAYLSAHSEPTWFLFSWTRLDLIVFWYIFSYCNTHVLVRRFSVFCDRVFKYLLTSSSHKTVLIVEPNN